MSFDLAHCTDLLERTPVLLRTWLGDLAEPWTRCDEGPDTWSPFDIVGHLVHGERADWIPRARIILSGVEHRRFEPFDRFAMFQDSQGKSLTQLLDVFEALRAQNLDTLRSLELDTAALDQTGEHPELGTVTLRQLLAAWVVHDLSHLAQIARVQAKSYRADVGPWPVYLPIVDT